MQWTTLERLRIYTGEAARLEGMPVYEFLVRRAHGLGLAGATVFRAMTGYVGQGEIHTTKLLRLSEDLPVVVEIVDTAEKVGLYCDDVLVRLEKGLVTREVVKACRPRG